MNDAAQGRVPIRRALVSVYDKSGLDALVRGLHEAGVALVSTGGSAALIEGLGLPVTRVEELTGFPECLDEYRLIARVRYLGQAAVPPWVSVRFYAGDSDMGGQLLGMMATQKALYPAEGEDVVLPLPDVPPAVKVGNTPVFVVVGDTKEDPSYKECRLDNNKASGSGKCNVAG